MMDNLLTSQEARLQPIHHSYAIETFLYLDEDGRIETFFILGPRWVSKYFLIKQIYFEKRY